ncbi:MAG: damage-inducible protein [Chlamydiae bacterium RIFCSPHIGHO2_12_FULL_49_9]|nr:MAG: damage-inducible protein [Chlamydiae bacterium RIFCSPHIGHO2_12_FULL_49_9]
MLTPIRTTQFKRDAKLAEKRGKNLSKLKSVMTKLAKEEVLDLKFKDHKLGGNYKNHRECHVEPDWLLIYRVDDKEIVYVRTGTHSDLFKQ